jgi:ectoine hydroxylase-related dioxygenase (phytanoyl-CoA dioxygenase family)
VVNSLWYSSKANNNKDHDCDGCGRATSAGFLVNNPGSTTQAWHRDGPDEGYINAFVPLVDLDESLGPTSILPLTHVMPNNIRLNNNDNNTDNSSSNDDTPLLPIIPTLKKGQILLFDYRTLHKGLRNTNAEGISRTLAYVVYTRGSITDVHNFPDALTLEYD